MATKDTYETLKKFYKTFDISEVEQKIISEYVESGEGGARLEACTNRKVEAKKLAHVCKPVISVVAKMQRESAEFQEAFRFWEYLALHIDFGWEDCDDKGVVLNGVKEIYSCGLSMRETLFLTAVNSDFKGGCLQNLYDSILNSLMKEKGRIGKPFDELYEAAFSMSVEDITFNKRLHRFFLELQCIVVRLKSKALKSLDEIKDLCEKIKFVRQIPRVTTDYDFNYAVKWRIKDATSGCYAEYLDYLKKKNKDWKAALIADGESVFTYAEQMKVYNGYVYGFRDIGEAYSALIAVDEIRDKLFSEENIAENNDDLTYERFEEAMTNYPDKRILFDGLCFSPCKKVVAYCNTAIDKRREELAEEFRQRVKTRTLPKYNAATVSALFEKWDDQMSEGRTFASLEEVETYAEKQKLGCSKLLDRFEFSVPVYGLDGRTAVSEKVLKVFLDKYFSMKDVYRNRTCDNMAAHFDRSSFRAFLDCVYAVWEASDFDNKLKAAVVPYCFYTSNENLYRLRKQCVAFCDAGRHALTANIIRTIALNGGKYALMLVDGISNKFPYPKAKQVAKDALSEAAEKYRIPVEVLADLIIPECGFDRDGRRSFGTDLTLTLLPEGDVRINRGDKVLKSLPSDTDAESKKEFSAMKKEVKTVIKMQTVRLERALMFGRSWTYSGFRRTYVDHPVMRLIVTNLVWGCYTAQGELLKSFRIGLDGRAENSGYDEVSLQDSDIVALVHPCDLSAEEVSSWREYIADNEMKQPFIQIGANVCYPLTIDEKEKCIDLTDYPFNYSHLQRIARKYEMVRTWAMDGGTFDGYYLEDKEAGIGVEIDMDELFFGAEPTDGENLKVKFYATDRKDEYQYVMPDQIPTRLVSSILSSLAAMMPAMQFATEGRTVKNAFAPYKADGVDFGEEGETAAEDSSVKNNIGGNSEV